MISMARSIGHGGKYVSYMNGESANKKHPEKIYFIQSHFLQPQLDGTAVENAFKNRCSGHSAMKKFAIELMFSPSPEHTKGYTLKDWAKLEDDFIEEYDAIELVNPETNKTWSEKTNLAGSKRVSFLHLESKSETPHIHIAACRVDENGNTNNDHLIHERAQWAAERVAIKRGWKTAKEIHKENAAEISKMCRQILLKMDSYSFEKYVAEIEKHGFVVHVKEGNTGYAIMNGHAKYKGSELDGRKFTIPNLKATWIRLHAENIQQQTQEEVRKQTSSVNSEKPSLVERTSVQQQVSSSVASPQNSSPQSSGPIGDYLEPRSGCSLFRFSYDGVDYRRYLPDRFIRMVNDEYDYRFFQNVDLHIGLASAIFAGIYAGLMAQAPVSAGGGGGGPTSGWGRKKDEDDELWGRRAIALANGIRPKKRKSKSMGL